MGLINETLNILNEAAFGDIRNLFRGNDGFNFMGKPIGLYQKSYGYMLNHLYRNIGNRKFTYDGYSTPIGELSNPFYNTIFRVPWFIDDDYKNSTSNYLDYIRTVYGATLGVENINEENFFKIIDDASIVGSVETSMIDGSSINPNGLYTDTKLGSISAYYSYETLNNSLSSNDLRKSEKYAITSLLSDYFGYKTKAITEHSVLNISDRFSNEDGRFNNLSPLTDSDSPVYVSNFGNIDKLGSYSGFYNSLSDKVKDFYLVGGLSEDNVYVKSRNKYYVNNDGENTYFTENGIFTDVDTNINDIDIRHTFKTLPQHKNISDASNGGVFVYSESEYGVATEMTSASFNFGTKFSRYTTYGNGLSVNDLLKKTNEGFRNGKYKTIIARFHTDGPGDITDISQTAVSTQYGLSHGRNLLKKIKDESEGYENPYCRVWTYHHQYKSLNDAIRPLNYTADELYNTYNFSAFTADHSEYGFEHGRKRLERFGSLNKNGIVNITPVDADEPNKRVDIKNCMFSIENLAWKDAFSTDQVSRETFQAGGLSPEQKGPFGGRIMWFPPYDLKFNEDVNVNWNENNFIGRGEGIYTYTNTTRTGTLSFKLLVDHPSIINYWENRGRSVSNSVDSIEDPEQELLRFFAGCDMLTGKPNVKSNGEQEDVISDEAIPSPTTKCIRFYVFFPNNYSGIDDGYEFAVNYLANGLGAGAERKWTKDSNGVCKQSTETTRYNIPNAPSDNGYGGYEIRPGKPISIVKTQTEGNLKIADVTIGNGGNTKVSDASGDKTQCNEGMTSLYVLEGDSSDQWWQRKWYYRIDNAYRNQLLKKESYIDRNSYGLNSNVGWETVAESIGVTNKDEITSNELKLMSFTDVYVALESTTPVTSSLENLFDSTKVAEIMRLKRNGNIDHIVCIGRASKQGYEKTNSVLAKNRAYIIKQWLSAKKLCDSNKIFVKQGETGGDGVGVNSGDESSITNKKWRCVEVNIYVKEESSKTIQASATENVIPGKVSPDESLSDNHELNIINGDMSNIGISRIPTWKDLSANSLVEYKELSDRITDIRLNKLDDGINGLALNNREPYKSRNVTISNKFDSTNDLYNNPKRLNSEYMSYSSNYNRGKSDYDYSVDYMHDDAAKTNQSINNSETEKLSYTVREGTKNNEGVRYDNEATFFRMLEKEEPFLHHKISDKVKYFDPAFHSISPEGFNARLTFLHQCTRQGPTVGASDNYTAENTANNLSFGRPPVCILRIGDFYYTKIILEGVTINFDPMMWDLNSEGIGVMPMIADVTLRFKFIGGSSLAGHITRLQNAVSFNYYANTEVYDNRAELAEYDENGNITKFAPFNPIKN